jgi:hypothetical protein
MFNPFIGPNFEHLPVMRAKADMTALKWTLKKEFTKFTMEFTKSGRNSIKAEIFVAIEEY